MYNRHVIRKSFLNYPPSRQSGNLSYGCLFLSGPPFKLLRAVRVALFVDCLSSISMTFHGHPVLAGMKELESLIRGMSSLKKLSLDYGSFGRAKEQEGVRAGLERVFDALAGSGCDALTLTGINIGPELSGHHDVALMTTLKTFEIYNSDILCPPLQEYIALSLNASPLHTLNLHDVVCSEGVSSVGDMLPRLNIPTLSHLYIFSRDIQWDDVVGFLGRHDAIVALTLKCDSQVPLDADALPPTALPLLSSLHATPQYVGYLLDSEGSLPCLENVVINPNFPFGQSHLLVEDQLADVDACLIKLAPFNSVCNLALFLPSGSDAEHLLSQLHHAEQSLLHILSLKLETSSYLPLDSRIMPLVIDWVGQFPSLQHLSLSACCTAMPPEKEIELVRAFSIACPSLRSVQVGVSSGRRRVTDYIQKGSR